MSKKTKTSKKIALAPTADVDVDPEASAAAKAERARRKLVADGQATLAQIVNLHIAGFTLTQIGEALGMSADEVDRMLASEASRYVRSQPALRAYVRNWVSERYTKMLEANWPKATDPNSPLRLENQDRVLRILDSMRKLHGADAPTQTEVKIETAPEAVNALVARLSEASGLGYDTNVFDVEYTEVSGNEEDEDE